VVQADSSSFQVQALSGSRVWELPFKLFAGVGRLGEYWNELLNQGVGFEGWDFNQGVEFESWGLNQVSGFESWRLRVGV